MNLELLSTGDLLVSLRELCARKTQNTYPPYVIPKDAILIFVRSWQPNWDTGYVVQVIHGCELLEHTVWSDMERSFAVFSRVKIDG